MNFLERGRFSQKLIIRCSLNFPDSKIDTRVTYCESLDEFLCAKLPSLPSPFPSSSPHFQVLAPLPYPNIPFSSPILPSRSPPFQLLTCIPSGFNSFPAPLPSSPSPFQTAPLPSSSPPLQLASSPAPLLQFPYPSACIPSSPLLISPSAIHPSHPANPPLLSISLPLPFQLSHPLFQLPSPWLSSSIPLAPLPYIYPLLLLPSSFPSPLITLSSSLLYPPDILHFPSTPLPSPPVFSFLPFPAAPYPPLQLPCHPATLPSSLPIRPYPPGHLPCSSLPTLFQLLSTFSPSLVHTLLLPSPSAPIPSIPNTCLPFQLPSPPIKLLSYPVPFHPAFTQSRSGGPLYHFCCHFLALSLCLKFNSET